MIVIVTRTRTETTQVEIHEAVHSLKELKGLAIDLAQCQLNEGYDPDENRTEWDNDGETFKIRAIL